MPKCILMVSSVLLLTSQVEHGRKCNSIDSENKSVKWNTNHHKCLMVCFYMLLYCYSTVKLAWTECSDAKHWLTQMCLTVRISWRHPATILLVLQLNKVSILLSSQRKAKAPCNDVLYSKMQGERQHGQMACHLLKSLFCSGYLTVEACMDNYVRISERLLQHWKRHIKPIQ